MLRIASITALGILLLSMVGCSASPSLSVDVIENAAGNRTLVLDGVDGDRKIDEPSLTGEIAVSDGCMALATSRSVYILILPEGAGFTDDALFDTSQGIYAIGESATLRGEIVAPADLSYGDQLPTDCGSVGFLAIDAFNN